MFVKADDYVVLHQSTTFTITYKLLKYLILSAKYWEYTEVRQYFPIVYFIFFK